MIVAPALLAIARRELRSQFCSPFAWLILAAGQFVGAYLFFIQLEDFLLAQERLRADGVGLSAFLLPRFFVPLCTLMLLLAPLLSMRLIAAERSAATLPLLLSAPVSLASIVAGKFLGALGLLSVLIALLVLMPLTLRLWVPVDVGAILLAGFGTWLCSASALAIGLYFSALTRHPAGAAVAAISVLLVLWLIGSGNDGELTSLTRFLSMPHHLQSFFSGLLDTRDIVYFLLLLALGLLLATQQLAAVRESG